MSPQTNKQSWCNSNIALCTLPLPSSSNLSSTAKFPSNLPRSMLRHHDQGPMARQWSVLQAHPVCCNQIREIVSVDQLISTQVNVIAELEGALTKQRYATAKLSSQTMTPDWSTAISWPNSLCRRPSKPMKLLSISPSSMASKSFIIIGIMDNLQKKTSNKLARVQGNASPSVVSKPISKMGLPRKPFATSARVQGNSCCTYVINCQLPFIWRYNYMISGMQLTFTRTPTGTGRWHVKTQALQLNPSWSQDEAHTHVWLSRVCLKAWVSFRRVNPTLASMRTTRSQFGSKLVTCHKCLPGTEPTQRLCVSAISLQVQQLIQNSEALWAWCIFSFGLATVGRPCYINSKAFLGIPRWILGSCTVCFMEWCSPCFIECLSLSCPQWLFADTFHDFNTIQRFFKMLIVVKKGVLSTEKLLFYLSEGMDASDKSWLWLHPGCAPCLAGLNASSNCIPCQDDGQHHSFASSTASDQCLSICWCGDQRNQWLHLSKAFGGHSKSRSTQYTKVLPSRHNCNLKTKAVTKHKARLNLHGGKQDFGMIYYDIYTLVVIWFATCMLFVFGILFVWSLHQVDFIMAYPQAPIKMDLYIELPQGIHLKNGNLKDHNLMLLANLYSQKLAGHVWNTILSPSYSRSTSSNL